MINKRKFLCISRMGTKRKSPRLMIDGDSEPLGRVKINIPSHQQELAN
jgi:hypothetical protein